MVFGSIEINGTWKKFPITPRNRFSSTLPESSTWLVQEPPLRLEASCTASSREGTPLASKRSMTDWLAVGFTRSSWQMKCLHHRKRECAVHAHVMIFLQARDGLRLFAR